MASAALPAQAVRLQKVIAQAGVTSRRKAEALIVQGRVLVNGKKVTTLGTTVDPATAVIVVDGKPLRPQAPLRYVLLHKPRGYVTTCQDEQGRPTVFALLKRQPVRLFPVGRLDVNSEGVLLLTNDGRLTHRLLHPRYAIPRIYLVHVDGVVSEDELAHLRRGVVLDDGKTLPAQVEVTRRAEKTCWLRMTLREGRPRQIHRMLQRCGGYGVKRLQRVAIGPLTVQGLPPGAWRLLEDFEIARLYRACHLETLAS
ncbi:MAG: rRNA pseudouridine synthase [candidate division KSB1 bacterium]|nr:rRNA pseudouridine synthase [candidate division KSB1 bacterium]